MINGGVATYTGTSNVSKWGPYNAFTRLELLANSQQSIFSASGYGMYIINCLKNALEKGHQPPNSSDGSYQGAAAAAVLNPSDPDFVFSGTDTAAGNNTAWTWFLNLPIAQRVSSLGGDIGMIPMATENSQLVFAFTPSSASTSSPYNLYGTAETLLTPYWHASNTVTIATPTIDLVREMYEAVENEADFPNFDWISQWIEETPQTFSGSQITWKQNQDAGILARVAMIVATSTPNGITTDKMTGADSLVLSYNSDIVKFKESGFEAVARQRDQIGYELPQGVFFYDLLGPDLTLADVMSSYDLPAIQLQMNIASAVTLNTSINPKVIAQRFLPLRIA